MMESTDLFDFDNSPAGWGDAPVYDQAKQSRDRRVGLRPPRDDGQCAGRGERI